MRIRNFPELRKETRDGEGSFVLVKRHHDAVDNVLNQSNVRAGDSSVADLATRLGLELLQHLLVRVLADVNVG